MNLSCFDHQKINANSRCPSNLTERWLGLPTVEATSNMATKTGDTLLRKHRGPIEIARQKNRDSIVRDFSEVISIFLN